MQAFGFWCWREWWWWWRRWWWATAEQSTFYPTWSRLTSWQTGSRWCTATPTEKHRPHPARTHLLSISTTKSMIDCQKQHFFTVCCTGTNCSSVISWDITRTYGNATSLETREIPSSGEEQGTCSCLWSHCGCCHYAVGLADRLAKQTNTRTYPHLTVVWRFLCMAGMCYSAQLPSLRRGETLYPLPTVDNVVWTAAPARNWTVVTPTDFQLINVSHADCFSWLMPQS